MVQIESDDSEEASLELREDVDFYFDDGLMVLTEKYLRERGCCCGSGCRHCTYGNINVPALQKIDLKLR